MPRADDRKVLERDLLAAAHRPPWADIHERYGPTTTCYNRFVRWRRLGVWERIFAAVSAAYAGEVQMIDSSSIQVHQHADVKKGARKPPMPPLGIVACARCMGRSRGGLTTKIHFLSMPTGQRACR